MVEVIKQIGLVAIMQVLSLVLEFIDTGTLSPTVRKRLSVEAIVLVVYVLGLTMFKGMIDDTLLVTIGSVYTLIVVKKLYEFLSHKKDEVTKGEDTKQ